MPTEQEKAKAALQRKLLDQLIKDKSKKDKIAKALTGTMQYEQYIVQATAEHMQYFASQGITPNEQTRSVAEKSARFEADKVIAEGLGSSLQGYRKEMEESRDVLDQYVATAQERIRVGEAVVAAVDEVKSLDFLSDKTSSNIIKITFDKAKLNSRIETLREKITKARQLKTQLNFDSPDEEVMRERLREYKKKIVSMHESLSEASRAVNSTVKATSFAINDKALEALARMVLAAEDLERLEKTSDKVDKLIDKLADLLDDTALIAGLLKFGEFANAAVKKGVEEGIVSKAKTDYREDHTQVEVLEEHNKDPLLLAKNLVRRQKQALDLLLKGLHATLVTGLAFAPPAGEIAQKVLKPAMLAITKVIESMLDKRIQLAQDAIAAQDPEKAAEYQADEEKAIEGEIKDKAKEILESIVGALKDAGQAALTEGKNFGAEFAAGLNPFAEIAEDPSSFAETMIDWFLPPIMEIVWEIFPPRPAETISGDDIVVNLDSLHLAQMPLGAVVQKITPQTMAAVEIGDRPSDIAEAAWGRFERTASGRTAFADDPAKRTYYVSMKVPGWGEAEIWGEFDPRTSTFTPDQIDGGSLDDWNDRSIGGSGYTDGPLAGEEPAVKGAWAMVTVGTRNYVVLNGADGAVHWGNRMANTRGPRGAASLLGTVVEQLSATTTLTMEPITL
jgi:hypothetical protein